MELQYDFPTNYTRFDTKGSGTSFFTEPSQKKFVKEHTKCRWEFLKESLKANVYISTAFNFGKMQQEIQYMVGIQWMQSMPLD